MQSGVGGRLEPPRTVRAVSPVLHRFKSTRCSTDAVRDLLRVRQKAGRRAATAFSELPFRSAGWSDRLKLITFG